MRYAGKRETIECKLCGKKVDDLVCKKRSYCSKICSDQDRSNRFVGDKHPGWKGNKASLDSIHTWLKKHYGKANKCEMPTCKSKSRIYQWAKLRGKKYEHKRENFWMLCVKCHKPYDMQDFKPERMMRSKGRPVSQFTLKGRYLKTFDSTGFAARYLGVGYNEKCRIYQAASGKKKNRIALNYIWKYE